MQVSRNESCDMPRIGARRCRLLVDNAPILSARHEQYAGARLRAAERLAEQLNSQLVLNREAQDAADKSRAVAEATMRRDLEERVESAVAYQCQDILQQHQVVVGRLQDCLVAQYSQTERVNDGALLLLPAVHLERKDDLLQVASCKSQAASRKLRAAALQHCNAAVR